MDEQWRSRAACRGAGPAAWFPERGEPADEARQVCAGCRVRLACLDDALDTEVGQRYGIRGGLTANERTKLARQRQRGRPAAVVEPVELVVPWLVVTPRRLYAAAL